LAIRQRGFALLEVTLPHGKSPLTRLQGHPAWLESLLVKRQRTLVKRQRTPEDRQRTLVDQESHPPALQMPLALLKMPLAERQTPLAERQTQLPLCKKKPASGHAALAFVVTTSSDLKIRVPDFVAILMNR